MRRIALLPLLLLALPASAPATATSCPQISVRGYDVRGIRQSGMGCEFARDIANHVVHHGCSRLPHFNCEMRYLPQQATHWFLRHRDNGSFVTFSLYLRSHHNPTH